jgi:hypothetical protein
VTMTGVIAVAHTVPACHSLETTVAATTAEMAATTSVPTSRPPRAGGATGWGAAFPRGGAALRCVLGCDDIVLRLRPRVAVKGLRATAVAQAGLTSVLADIPGRTVAAARAYARTAMPAAARWALASATVWRP